VGVSLVFFLCFGSTAIADESAVPRFAAKLHAGGESLKVVCFGDSVTGVYYHTGGRRAYTDMIAIALEQENPGVAVQAINAGISGNTTVDALARIENDVLAREPDLVTIMFGLNDVARLPIDDYRATLTTIIKKCREADAEVLLCTPNSVRDTDARSIAKLEQYVVVAREVAVAEHVPLVDCYRAFEDVRGRDALDWAFLMSDDIHPNMDGHKLIAEEIAGAILGRSTSLKVAGPIPLAIPHTIAQLNAGESIHVTAMPPYDSFIATALRSIWPDGDVTVTSWPVAGESLAAIEARAKDIRGAKPDLVFIAVPADVDVESTEVFIERFSWVLNYSMSFGIAEWDCVAVAPSVANTGLHGEEREIDRWMRRLIRAQDLAAIDINEENEQSVEAVLVEWVKHQHALFQQRN